MMGVFSDDCSLMTVFWLAWLWTLLFKAKPLDLLISLASFVTFISVSQVQLCLTAFGKFLMYVWRVPAPSWIVALTPANPAHLTHHYMAIRVSGHWVFIGTLHAIWGVFGSIHLLPVIVWIIIQPLSWLLCPHPMEMLADFLASL